jgi:hypothetical protein
VPGSSASLTSVSSAKNFAPLIVKILLAKVGIAIRSSPNIPPPIAGHIFFSHKVFLEVRHIFSNLDDAYWRV